MVRRLETSNISRVERRETFMAVSPHTLSPFPGQTSHASALERDHYTPWLALVNVDEGSMARVLRDSALLPLTQYPGPTTMRPLTLGMNAHVDVG
jgi:hypothetical protein